MSGTGQLSDCGQASEIRVLERTSLPTLVDILRKRGYTVIGPTISNGAIAFDEIESVDDLPIGYTDEQEAGTYRLRRREDDAVFGYVVGPHSVKRFLLPPRLRLWHARSEGAELLISPDESPAPPYAFLGVRPCDVHAVYILDRVLMGDEVTDSGYRSRRSHCLVLAVNCTAAGGSCFCVSMGTGPGVSRAEAGYDLALTELLDGSRHEFLVEAATARGAEFLSALPTRPAGEPDRRAADTAVARAANIMGRSLETNGLRELLQANSDHSRWQAIAARCLTCTNCTMVCPTCFCTTVEDTTDLTGTVAERWRRWDSCFTIGFSYVHGGSVRTSAMARYRQWMTHKLASWHDQFGASGCVGCGRCITWCPVGIDITAEARAIREDVARPQRHAVDLEE